MILLTIVIFFLVLGLLVLVHEFGHFIVAKRAGMKVEEFGFGFPPKLFSFKMGETLYSYNLVPLGGFVKIVGEDGSGTTDPRSFGNKPIWQRFLVLIAGVSMNVVLAWVLISIGLGIGLPAIVGEGEQLPKSAIIKNVSVGIVEVAKDSPAEKSHIKIGDKILSINNQPVSSVEQVQKLTLDNAGKETAYVIKRGSEELTVLITPRSNPPQRQGALGVGLASVGSVSYPWYEVLYRGFIATVNLLVMTVTAIFSILGKFLTGHAVGAALSGPVGIAVLTRDVTALGFVYLLQFVAVLSINLAIINAIPFPALDGGRVLFLLIERIRRKKLPVSAEQIANTLGFVLLILLMVVVTVKDVARFSDKFINLFERIKNIL